MFKIFTLCAALTGAAFAAQAETITLDAPGQGASLHTGGIDMAVYFTQRGDAMEVVSRYVAPADRGAREMQMGLGDGDAVTFFLPGQAHVAYRFAREGDALRVTARYSGTQLTKLAE